MKKKKTKTIQQRIGSAHKKLDKIYQEEMIAEMPQRVSRIYEIRKKIKKMDTGQMEKRILEAFCYLYKKKR